MSLFERFWPLSKFNFPAGSTLNMNHTPFCSLKKRFCKSDSIFDVTNKYINHKYGLNDSSNGSSSTLVSGTIFEETIIFSESPIVYVKIGSVYWLKMRFGTNRRLLSSARLKRDIFNSVHHSTVNCVDTKIKVKS